MSKAYEPISEQRQYLNISNQAYETLISDIAVFGEKGGLSGIVNRILLNYMEESEASISSAVERKRQEYIEIIQTGKKKASGELPELSPIENRTIELLLSDYRKKLTDHYRNDLPPKEKAFTIRLQNRTYETLGPVPLADTCYRSNGDFIRAILEEYASKSIFQREAIYFKTIFEMIRAKLLVPEKDRLLTTIKTRSTSGKILSFRAKPVALSKESDAPYHYLIALSRPASDSRNIYTPAAFRLSRLEEIYDTKGYGSGKITAKEKKTLEEAIKTKSVPYLLDDTDDYSVKLTPQGVVKYRSILHLRPVADKTLTEELESGGQILHFRCTYRQIENYFFQFGKDAKIISPEKYAIKFGEEYKAAYEVYTSLPK